MAEAVRPILNDVTAAMVAPVTSSWPCESVSAALGLTTWTAVSRASAPRRTDLPAHFFFSLAFGGRRRVGLAGNSDGEFLN